MKNGTMGSSVRLRSILVGYFSYQDTKLCLEQFEIKNEMPTANPQTSVTSFLKPHSPSHKQWLVKELKA